MLVTPSWSNTGKKETVLCSLLGVIKRTLITFWCFYAVTFAFTASQIPTGWVMHLCRCLMEVVKIFSSESCVSIRHLTAVYGSRSLFESSCLSSAMFVHNCSPRLLESSFIHIPFFKLYLFFLYFFYFLLEVLCWVIFIYDGVKACLPPCASRM